jgi:hypothetical protein
LVVQGEWEFAKEIMPTVILEGERLGFILGYDALAFYIIRRNAR